MIDSREELVDALTEAAELEHGLLLQYLFAAYSLKKRADEGLTPRQQEDVRRWEGVLAGVAREEMAHLGSVCNLLAAVGGAPRLGRPNFPQPAKRYYPFDFRLQRFGDQALYRFLCFELPKGEPPPPPPVDDRRGPVFAAAVQVVPDPLMFEFIGELYGQIADGFRSIPEAELFIGPRFAQDTDDWSNRMALHLVTDRASAERAIDAIVREGEGAPGVREGSHYGRFLEIRSQLARLPDGCDPARPVVLDPRTRSHRDAPDAGTLLGNEHTVAVAELLNATYITALLMLLAYYAFSGETPAQRAALRAGLRHLMSGVIRPLSEVLTELPADDDPAVATAGPPFELYADVRLSPHQDNRWSILLERLGALGGRAGELAADGPSARLRLLAQNLQWIHANIDAAAREAA